MASSLDELAAIYGGDSDSEIDEQPPNPESLYDIDDQSAFMNRLLFRLYTPKRKMLSIRPALDHFRQVLRQRIETLLETNPGGLKFWLGLEVIYGRPYHRDEEITYLVARVRRIFMIGEFDQQFDNICFELEVRNGRYLRAASGLVLYGVERVALSIARFAPFVGGHGAPLPDFLQKKQAIINICDQGDGRCFGYALLLGLLPNIPRNHRLSDLRPLFYQYSLDTLNYPVSIDAIGGIEDRFNIAINIFSFFDDEGRGRYPLRLARRDEGVRVIDMLYWNEHFAYISNLSAFVADLSKSNHRLFICRRCMGHFSKQLAYHRHRYCSCYLILSFRM